MRGNTKSAAVLGGTPPLQAAKAVSAKLSQKATASDSLYSSSNRIGTLPTTPM